MTTDRLGFTSVSWTEVLFPEVKDVSQEEIEHLKELEEQGYIEISHTPQNEMSEFTPEDIPDPGNIELPDEHRSLMPTEKRACMSYWYPKLDVVNTPFTNIIEEPLTPKMKAGEDKEGWDNLVEQVDEIYEWMTETASLGPPLFFRTGQTSGKHNWENTAKLDRKGDIPAHIHALARYSDMASLSGLPVNVWVLREWLDIDHEFTAYGGMPVGREFRFFVQEGDIVHVQPYWPPDSIKKPSRDDWEDLLGEINEMDDLEGARVQALKVARDIGRKFEHQRSAWSVDVCKTTGGAWYVTDMAPARLSYFWDPSGEYESLSEKVSPLWAPDYDGGYVDVSRARHQ